MSQPFPLRPVLSKPVLSKSFFPSLLLIVLSGCASSRWAADFQRAIAADPRLKDNPVLFGASPSPAVTSASPSPTAPTPTPQNSPAATRTPPTGDSQFIGPPLPPSFATKFSPSPGSSPNSSPAATPTPQPTAGNQLPTALQAYITDLTNLGALPTGNIEPNKTVTRREYARWLVAANNLIYANQPARQIRVGTSSDQPAFQDVAANDPDFASIQGLANAGLIPSPLSGESSTVTFRPNSPLTREDLLFWKVPVDIRRALPNATLDAVKETWGFQDSAKIDPKVMRAVLADYQNSDLSNIRRAFGYTTLFNPKKTVNRAEAAAVLWFFGAQGDGLSAKDALEAKSSPSPSP